MKIHSHNSYDDDQNDPIAELLRQASVTEQDKVTGSREFASRLRARIESGLDAEGSPSVRLASREVATGRSRLRGRLVTWVGAAATIAATLLLLASSFSGNRSTESQTVQSPVDSGMSSEVPDDALPAADVKKGLQLVNAGLGQTFQSVELARSSIRNLLRPVQSRASGPPVEATTNQQASRSPGFADDQLVASFTARVLGLRNQVQTEVVPSSLN